MPTLVIAEHNNKNLHKATLHAVTAAQKLGHSITILVAGHRAGAVAKEAAAIEGIERVFYIDAPYYEHASAENMALLIEKYASFHCYALAAATSMGRNIMPRLAGLMDAPLIADIIEIKGSDLYARPYNAGALIVEEKSSAPIKLITVRPSAFEPAKATGGMAEIDVREAMDDLGLSQFISVENIKSERPELVGAKVVVSGGRGIGSAEDFRNLIEPLADALGGAVGASRAAVDAGYATSGMQVGQTGKVVAPDLYIAAGISGQIQHLAGMKDSKVIVAINTDPKAPIFEVADYGLIADYRKAIPELMAHLSASGVRPTGAKQPVPSVFPSGAA